MKESPSEDSISSTVDQANRTYTMWSTLAWSRFRNYIHKLMFTMKRWSENEGGGKKNGYSLRRSTSICGSVLRLAGRFPEPCKCAHKHGTPHSPTDLPPEYSWPRDSRACNTDFTEGISTTTVQWLVGGSRCFHLPKNWKVMCDSNIASHGQMLAWHNIPSSCCELVVQNSLFRTWGSLCISLCISLRSISESKDRVPLLFGK
jgi:hypothetical protein